MFKRNLKGCSILAVGALIWGLAFIFQSVGADSLSPFTFNLCRSVLAAIILFPVCLIFGNKDKTVPYCGFGSKKLIIGGILTGLFLFIALSLQQIGIGDVSAGKTAFLTAMYIVFAPIVSVFLGKKAGLNVIVGVITGMIGMYLLCMMGETMFGKYDLMIILCAFAFTGHIIVIDKFSSEVDCIRMSFIQFIVCGLLSLPFVLIIEKPSFSEIVSAIGPLLYTGVMSGAVAYTLQIIGQKYADVTPASLTMSLESVFAAIAGNIYLNEKMNGYETLGCILIFAAVVLSQIPVFNLLKRKKQ